MATTTENKAAPTEKVCKTCTRMLPLAQYSRPRNGYYSSYCKDCVKQQSKTYYHEKHPPAPRAPNQKKPHKLTDEIKQQYSAGDSIAVLSARHNVSSQTLRWWKRMNYITRPEAEAEQAEDQAEE